MKKIFYCVLCFYGVLTNTIADVIADPIAIRDNNAVGASKQSKAETDTSFDEDEDLLTLEPTVALRNGNFYNISTDIFFSNSTNFKIERTYNSKSDKKTAFGWGWAFSLATHLKASADGGVVIYESGSGAKNFFYPNSKNNKNQTHYKKQIETNVDKIILAAKSKGLFSSNNATLEYKTRLTEDSQFRDSEWEKFFAYEPLKEIPVGATFTSAQFSYQTLKKTAQGFERSDGALKEEFNQNGNLVNIYGPYDYLASISYRPDGKINQYSEKKNTWVITFDYNTQGLISSVKSTDGQEVKYVYNKFDELIQAIPKDKNQTIAYVYDTKQRHNLLEVQYPDKKSLKISYYDNEPSNLVKSYQDTTKESMEYAYKGNSNQPGNFTVIQTYKNKDGQVISSISYTYTLKRNAAGELKVAALEANSKTINSKVEYDPICDTPTKMVQNGVQKTYAFNAMCLLVKQTSPTENVTLTYDKKFPNKVKMITKEIKSGPMKGTKSKTIKRVFTFDYNPQGDIENARDSFGGSFQLTHARNGQIIKVKQKNAILELSYDENSQPIQIVKKENKKAPCTLNISYKNTGEIKEVSLVSTEKMAPQAIEDKKMEILSNFEEMSDLLKEASVKL